MFPSRADALSLIGAAALAALPFPLRAQQNTMLRIASPPNDDLTPALYALKSGAFAAAGLHVTIDKMASGAAIASAIIGGSLDLGLSSLTSLFAARLHGVPLKIVAAGGLYLSEVPSAQLIVPRAATYASGRDLNGKTFGTYALRDLYSTADLAWVDATGGDSHSLKFVELPASALLPALEDGRIDAVTLGSPTLEVALQSPQLRPLAKSMDAIGKRFLRNAYFASESFIAANADALRRFNAVMRVATQYSNRHPKETAPLIAAYAGLDLATVANGVRVECAETLRADDVQPLIDAAVRYNVIDRPVTTADIIARI